MSKDNNVGKKITKAGKTALLATTLFAATSCNNGKQAVPAETNIDSLLKVSRALKADIEAKNREWKKEDSVQAPFNKKRDSLQKRFDSEQDSLTYENKIIDELGGYNDHNKPIQKDIDRHMIKQKSIMDAMDANDKTEEATLKSFKEREKKTQQPKNGNTR